MNITKGEDSLNARIMFGFDIPPEMFTREDIARADEVDLRQIKDVLEDLEGPLTKVTFQALYIVLYN